MKFLNKVFVVFFVFLSGMSHVAAQGLSTLSGQAGDSEGKGLPFANIMLLKQSDGELITGAVSDEEGRFSLTTASVEEAVLSISSVGYVTYTTAVIELKPGLKRDFGTLRLEEELATLGEVMVQS